MATNYSSYFDKLPKVKYDINRSLVNPRYQTVTNIFFRVNYMKEVLNNIGSYFTVELDDADTPEILAEKVYGDPGAAWMILMANHIIDPQWEWPLDYDQFNKYLTNKYGSVENSQTSIHHYEMVITRTLNPGNYVSKKRYIVNENNLTNNDLTVPYNYYYPKFVADDILADDTNVKADSTEYTVDLGYTQTQSPTTNEVVVEQGLRPGSLAVTQYYNTYNLEGKTIIEIVNGTTVTNYEYENDLNLKRRLINVVKKDYYTQIINEFNQLTNTSPSYIRRLA